ncbi:GIY-YIG nuclease family protein [Candidatus Poseidoniaceae archaeon]|nr:GIY-YIG nuclease family protein [Candidatus Poseidoniaceae archaeon]
MVREQHCSEAYFLSFFYTITRTNRKRNDKKIITGSRKFKGLKDFSDYCFSNVKEVRHYYHNRQVIESDARNSFKSFISAKSDEFWINDQIPLPSWSERDRDGFGSYTDRHEETYQKWKRFSYDELKIEVDKLLDREQELTPILLGNLVPSTPRGRREVVHRQPMEDGYVYVIENKNPALSGWKKIGYTSSLENRMNSYRTYEPNQESEFVYLTTFKSNKAYEIEQRTHQFLNETMTEGENKHRKGEWYYIELEDAIEFIKANWIE